MSQIASARSDTLTPAWLCDLLGLRRAPHEGEIVDVRGTPIALRNGILRLGDLSSAAQAQTGQTFGFKWAQRNTFESPASLGHLRAWLLDRYGDPSTADWFEDGAILLDAGCGAAMSALELFGPALRRVRYLGVDISTAVEIARDRLAERGVSGGFIQGDLCAVPLPPESVGLIFSEGALHHTDSTEVALKSLARLLCPGGRFLFYVYRRKGPIREFTDNYVRGRVQGVPPQTAWQMLEPLTRLGQALGELDAEIEIPEPIDLLGIPAGRINVQRLFYWHVAKAFYRPDFTLDEMNHINFDWYAPKNAHRQSPEEVRRWCAESNLVIERERTEEAGITIVARKERRG